MGREYSLLMRATQHVPKDLIPFPLLFIEAGGANSAMMVSIAVGLVGAGSMWSF